MRLNPMILTIVAAAACVSSRPCAKPAQHRDTSGGVISGTVLYENGKPVKGATALAEPLGRPIGAIIPHADTDEAGHFAIHIPLSWFGWFSVAAKKEDEDYPEMNQFYSNGKFQTVILSERHPAATVTIRLGPKAGVLEGEVTDAVTGAVLNPCVELRRASNPENFLSGSGLIHRHYRLLIPSDAAVFIKIWQDGYRAWYYPGTISKSDALPIRLSPGEKRTVDISLQPDRRAKNTGCGAPLWLQ